MDMTHAEVPKNPYHPLNKLLNKAASEYEEQVVDALEQVKKCEQEKAAYGELAAVLQSLAEIKREVAGLADGGAEYDWTVYRKLSDRRNDLQRKLSR